jgi:hypothetical protein
MREQVRRVSGDVWPAGVGKLLLLLLAGLTLGCSSKGASATGEAVVTVDPAQHFQTIVGWETEPYMSDPSERLSPELMHQIIRSAVKNAGITRIRLGIGSGAESRSGAHADYAAGGSNSAWAKGRYLVTNDNADPRVIDWAGFDFAEIDRNVELAVLPLRKELAARGEKLFINLCYVAFVKGQPNAHDDPEEYAEFALATVLHLRQKYGLEPDTLEVILEPDLAGGWSGRRIGQAIVATSRRFAENGIRTRFLAPSTMNMAAASLYFDDMRRTTDALPHLAELSYHRYKGVSKESLAELSERSAKYHVPISMLELWFGEAGPDVLFEDLGAGAVAFQGRVLADLFVNARKGNLTLNKDVQFNGALFRAIRPGAIRVGTSSSRSELKALAFRRPKGGIVTAIRTKGPTNVTVRGLPADNYVVSMVTDTSETDHIPTERSVDGDLHVPVPASAVVIIEPR